MGVNKTTISSKGKSHFQRGMMEDWQGRREGGIVVCVEGKFLQKLSTAKNKMK